MYASLLVSFRGAPRPLLMNGACWPKHEARADTLYCKFFLDRLQDTLVQGVDIAFGDDIKVTVGGDWNDFRRKQEPGGDGRMTSDDAAFLLRQTPLSSCRFPRGFWNAKGPTKKLLGWLP
jgi:hypothetical protein